MTECRSEYSQITTYLRGRFRPLNGPEDNAYAPLSTLPAGPSREEFAAASNLPEIVTKFLCQLDSKIDAILMGMQSPSLEQDFPHTMELSTLSASCLDFSTAVPLAPGDWIEVVLDLRQAGLAAASGIGSITARRVAKNGIPIFSFAFSRIREEEREKIIRYVFREERRQLRANRLE